MSSTIVWKTRSSLDQIAARAASRMKAVFTIGNSNPARLSVDEFLALERSSAPKLLIELRRSEAFYDIYEAPLKSERELQKLFVNEVSRIAPLDDTEVTLLPVAAQQPGTFSVLQIRNQILEKLEDHARTIGTSKLILCAEDQSDQQFDVPLYIRQSNLSRSLSALAFGLVLCGAWIAISSLADQREGVAEQWSLQELALRGQVATLTETSIEAQAYEQFAAMEPEHISPQGTLQRLALLTEATPNSAWWTELNLSADAIQVSAVSVDAGQTLQSISNAFPDQSVGFEGSVSDLREGNQSFTIKISEAVDDE